MKSPRKVSLNSGPTKPESGLLEGREPRDRHQVKVPVGIMPSSPARSGRAKCSKTSLLLGTLPMLLMGACRNEVPEEEDTAAPPEVSSHVDTTQIVGTISAMNGVQGSPSPLNSGSASLVSRYRDAEIPIVRIPVGDGPRYALSGVFPDASAPTDDPESYDFAAIDYSLSGIIDSGAEPLWQATYDIGSTDEWEMGCFHRGYAPQDLEIWAQVVKHVLMHFNEGWADGYDWNVRYVESLNEPFKAGLYERSDYMDVWLAYQAMAVAVQEYNAEYGRDVKVVGHSNPVSLNTGPDDGPNSDIWLLDDFLTFITANDVPFDIFSYHQYGDYYEQWETAVTVREHLDAAGFEDTPIWNTEWNTKGFDSQDTATASAYFASHNAQTKTMWQDLVEQAFIYRASQRPIGEDQFGWSFCDDIFYLAIDATPRPAYYGWLVFRDMEAMTPNRLAVDPIDSNKVTFLAGSSDTGQQLSVLLSYWAMESSADLETDYYVYVDGLEPGSIWWAELRTVEASTTDYEARSQQFLTADEGGTIMLTGTMSPWKIHYWYLVLTN